MVVNMDIVGIFEMVKSFVRVSFFSEKNYNELILYYFFI